MNQTKKNTAATLDNLDNLKNDMLLKFSEVKSEIAASESRINKRLTEVIDLVTVAFEKKIGNHEKRITKLEKFSAS